MARLEDVDVGELTRRLDEVEEKESAQRLMAAIAHKRGLGVAEVADWFGFEPATVDAWFDEFETGTLDETLDHLERYWQRSATPLVPPTRSRVEFLNYEVLDDHGWDLEDEDLFEKAHEADLDPADHGRVLVEHGESILEAVEKRGFSWPYACRGGACSNCAVILKEGEVAMPGDHILPDEMVYEHDARLACVGAPVTEEVKLVYNAKLWGPLDDLRLPPSRFDVEFPATQPPR